MIVEARSIFKGQSMQRPPKHFINVSLNSAGFKGRDLDKLIPDFMADRSTTLGLFWEPSYNGPHSWIVDIIVLGSLFKISELFLGELFSDLYNYSKKKLAKFLEKTPNNYGSINIKFKDFEIICHGYYIPQDKFFEVFEVVPRMFPLLDASKGKTWLVKFDVEKDKWTISPDN
jgi:hypothetical protein